MKSLITAAVLALLSLPAMAAPGAHEFAFGQPAPAAKATRTVEVVLGDMYFEPRSLEVKAGETVRFVVINKGQVTHEFNLGDAAMHAQHQKEMLAMATMDHASMGHGGMEHGAMQHDEPNMVMVAPGQRGELTWSFSQSTPIEFACNVPGHYQAGMVGKLTIAQ
ncbi:MULTISPECIES: cupredoxin family protein [unclassified Pseudomonas]|uniref:cupredoxin domain-containing protein n=1 Tax=unclassified Pseudomonas TaxID=196821 RepID=UPI0021C8D799|nr:MULTISPECIES: cupredoxin family protein [unclassified Pseudomonas]MCU1732756.1 cupredoxin family protein [Pseudomonas sp. 20P_3.2_Bac4]MCU1745063.1 cupredoxin family protein [Pseudomonas sp. 20P_3.2_Bac5]